MLDKIKKYFEKKEKDKVTSDVLEKLNGLREEQRKELETQNKMWEEREWEACVRLYCHYESMTYEQAVYNAHKLVETYKKGVNDEVNESK